jgi:hypothetical protein
VLACFSLSCCPSPADCSTLRWRAEGISRLKCAGTTHTQALEAGNEVEYSLSGQLQRHATAGVKPSRPGRPHDAVTCLPVASIRGPHFIHPASGKLTTSTSKHSACYVLTHTLYVLQILGAVAASAVASQFSVSNVFGNGMTLQAGDPGPRIWGWADPDAIVTVYQRKFNNSAGSWGIEILPRLQHPQQRM